MTEGAREIRVVLVDDHLMVRKGVELLLRSQDMAVIGVAESPEEAMAVIGRRQPDVALVDINLAAGASGVDLARQVAAEAPGVNVLLYTGAGDSELLGEALESGAQGLALKAGAPGELVEAVRVVARGGTYFDPRLGELIMNDPQGPDEPLLSPREREVFTLLARGLTGEEVAAELVLSPETIRTHVRNAMTKLHAKTRVHALALALERNEIP